MQWQRTKPERFFGMEEYRPRGYPVRVTTPERTLLDALRQPDLCGGFDNMLRAWALAQDTLNLDCCSTRTRCMTSFYPRTFAEISGWAREQGSLPSEARLRFAQYAILHAVADSRALSNQLVLKGGNALDFIRQPNRSTQDLDFSVREGDMAEAELRTLLVRALEIATRELGILLRLQRLRQQPPGESKTFITYKIPIGYVLRDATRNRTEMEQGRHSAAIIPVDISLNEVVCEDAFVDVRRTHQLRVSSLEDIVAEKSRALLQQPLRNRTREQDLLDIAIVVQAQPALDRDKVARFLQRKAAARQVSVSREAFHNPAVAQRAGQDYERLRQTARTFIPLEEAIAVLYGFIATLAIPETVPIVPSPDNK